MTLEALGALIGVDKATVSRWERFEVKIPAERLRGLCRVTGLSLAALRPDLFGAEIANSEPPAPAPSTGAPLAGDARAASPASSVSGEAA